MTPERPDTHFSTPGEPVMLLIGILAGVTGLAWVGVVCLVASGREASYVGLSIAAVSVGTLAVLTIWDRYSRLKAMAEHDELLLATGRADAEKACTERSTHHAELLTRLDALTARQSAILNSERQLLAALDVERQAREAAASAEVLNIDKAIESGPKGINGSSYPRAIRVDR